MKPVAYKSRHVQNWLHSAKRDAMAVLLPNYSPDCWHECDMFGVTKAGYFHEFEIKLTRADFKADAKKRQQDRYEQLPDGPGGLYRGYRRIPMKTKHERLAIGDDSGPSRFWYVTPKDLITVAEVPAWAGLMVVDRHHDSLTYGFFDVVKDASRLHQKHVAKSVLRHAINVCYYRFWAERHRADRLAQGVTGGIP